MPNARIEFFLDSNILIYAAAGRLDEPAKYKVASTLVESGAFGVSAQTLAEFCHVVRRRALLPDAELDEWLRFLDAFPGTPVDNALVRKGLAIARRYGIGYYDAALLAAAGRLGASLFYSEDLNHGQMYGDVRVINPFLQS